MHRRLTRLAIAALLVAPTVPASALDGCPKGEFTTDSCVLILPGYCYKKTGNTGNRGLPCYTVVKIEDFAAGEGGSCEKDLAMTCGDADPVEPAFFASASDR